MATRRQASADQKQVALPQVVVQHFSEEKENVQQRDLVLPDDSQLEVVEQEDSNVYEIHPENSGVGTFLFLFLWNGFVSLGGLMVYWENEQQQQNGLNGPSGIWIVIVVLGLLGTVGVLTLVGSIYSAWQSAMIGVKNGLLFIERKTIVGTK
ncbi:MAG: hypothetical protein HKN47_00150 [Pirellulaceae bacterium]|nr:hypothetical protein [Pirellulaceae bacterium]